MADAYVGEIRAFGFTWAPEGWFACNGQLLMVSQNQVLYAVLGNAFGGTPNLNFNLPNLQGRSPMGSGQGTGFANMPYPTPVGAEAITLGLNQLPSHSHTMLGAKGVGADSVGTPDATSYQGRFWNKGVSPAVPVNDVVNAAVTPANSVMGTTMLSSYGGGGGHENRQPLLVMNFCINWDGVYPMRAS
jgi:microcystin-dependent protein